MNILNDVIRRQWVTLRLEDISTFTLQMAWNATLRLSVPFFMNLLIRLFV